MKCSKFQVLQGLVRLGKARFTALISTMLIYQHSLSCIFYTYMIETNLDTFRIKINKLPFVAMKLYRKIIHFPT